MFTCYGLKKVLIQCCGGQLNGAFVAIWSRPVWEILELIQVCVDIAEEQNQDDSIENVLK